MLKKSAFWFNTEAEHYGFNHLFKNIENSYASEEM